MSSCVKVTCCHVTSFSSGTNFGHNNMFNLSVSIRLICKSCTTAVSGKHLPSCKLHRPLIYVWVCPFDLSLPLSQIRQHGCSSSTQTDGFSSGGVVPSEALCCGKEEDKWSVWTNTELCEGDFSICRRWEGLPNQFLSVSSNNSCRILHAFIMSDYSHSVNGR